MKAALALLALVVTVSGGVATASAVTARSAALRGSAPPSSEALAEIQSNLLRTYEQASQRCSGLPWQLLAAVGWVESRHGGPDLDDETGWPKTPIIGPALDGRPGFAAIPDSHSPDGWAHALGPMQLLPATWRQWAVLAPQRAGSTDAGGTTAPDPQNAWDAIYTAAKYLCAGQPKIGDLHAAVLSYNRSEAYFDEVWSKAVAYGMAFDGSTGRGLPSEPIASGAGIVATGDPARVVAAALSQAGVPYVWGGSTAGVALDCSGLVVVAFRATGVEVPRTTFAQVKLGFHVGPEELRPADLLFFRGGRPTRDFGHVAIYIGGGRMVVAPRTGETVRVSAVPFSALQEARRVLA